MRFPLKVEDAFNDFPRQLELLNIFQDDSLSFLLAALQRLKPPVGIEGPFLILQEHLPEIFPVTEFVEPRQQTGFQRIPEILKGYPCSYAPCPSNLIHDPLVHKRAHHLRIDPETVLRGNCHHIGKQVGKNIVDQVFQRHIRPQLSPLHTLL